MANPKDTTCHKRRCRIRTHIGLTLAVGISIWIISLASCSLAAMAPDQDQFVPLKRLSKSDQAIVRLYAAPIPSLEWLAIHPWFVIKRAKGDQLQRWEVWQSPSGPYDHVQFRTSRLTSDVGAGGVVILAELTGPEAEKIASFIETCSPVYPWRDNYSYFPGPNSNTYAQWVLDETGWDVTLPASAIGKGMAIFCPELTEAELDVTTMSEPPAN